MGEVRVKRRELVGNDDEKDRLSLLPDDILIVILALLPLRSAVATSLLSRRWRYLWTKLTHLNLGPDVFGTKPPWLTTINNLFPWFKSDKINSLRLYLPLAIKHDDVQDYCSSLKSWIFGRHVEQIEVTYPRIPYYGPAVTLPTCMFQSQCLGVLKLHGNFIYEEGLTPCLPNLKILYLKVYSIPPELLVKLFKSCILLEELLILHCLHEGEHSAQCFDLSAINLKKLCLSFDDELPENAQFVINSSKLEEITLENLCLDSVRFIKNPSALITAKIRFCDELIDCHAHDNKLQLAELISGVSSLILNSTAFKVLAELDDSLLPNFNNLTDLDIELHVSGCSWNDVLRFLRVCPNLEALNLKYPQQAVNCTALEYPIPCGLTNVKSIKIKSLKGSKGDIQMIEDIMNCAKVLKLLSVDVSIPCKRKETIFKREWELCLKLLSLQKSSACELQFNGKQLDHLSSKGDGNSQPRCQRLRVLGQTVH